VNYPRKRSSAVSGEKKPTLNSRARKPSPIWYTPDATLVEKADFYSGIQKFLP
jgi:hypothetical protein